MSGTNFVRLFSTLACTAGLLVAAGSVCYGTALPTNNPTGFTNEVNLFPFVSSPFTDASGNTATLEGTGSSEFLIASNSSGIFTVTFAHPVVKAGFDISSGLSAGPFQLSNGDSTAASSCATFPCFLGVIDNIPFTSFSNMVTTGMLLPTSDLFFLDFRYTSAFVVTPEPATGTLIAPLLIAGLAALMLKRRAQ